MLNLGEMVKELSELVKFIKDLRNDMKRFLDLLNQLNTTITFQPSKKPTPS